MSAMEIDTQPAQPYTFDLGNMMCEDTNPLPTMRPDTQEAILSARAQACAQALIHQLLKTCPITRAADDGNLQITLPAPATALPREKSVPKEKEQTKWERFAAKKGIKAKRRDGKLEYSEARGDWVAKYGYKGKKAAGTVENDWLEEVEPEKPKQEEKIGHGGRKVARQDGPRHGDVGRRDMKIKARKGK